MPQYLEIGAYCFCPVCLCVCLSVCVSVCLSVCPSVRNFNLAYNFFVIEAILMKLGTHVHHHRSYILTKGHNSKMHFDQIMPLFRLWQLTADALVLSQGAAWGICGVSQTQPSCSSCKRVQRLDTGTIGQILLI